MRQKHNIELPKLTNKTCPIRSFHPFAVVFWAVLLNLYRQVILFGGGNKAQNSAGILIGHQQETAIAQTNQPFPVAQVFFQQF